MISNWFKKLKFEDAHPPEETLLACVDGELSAREAARVRAHLENCWSCRAQLDELQETITLFVNFRNQIQNPLTAPPPDNWSGFERKLAQKKSASENNDGEKISIANRFGFWQKFQKFFDFAEWSSIRKQISIGAIAAFLMIALLSQLIKVQSVSGAELLENSIRSDNQKIERIIQPVVYQKLRLTRAGAGPVDWEAWRDRAHSRYRQAVADERAGKRRFLPSAFDPGKNDFINEPVLREVAEILQVNQMNAQQPLSAESFAAWRKSLSKKSDEIENLRSQNGVPIFVLKTFAASDVENGKIIEAALTVRASDWHAEALRFSVKSETGANDYEFIETAFEVVSLTSLNPEIFPRDKQPVKTEIAAAEENVKQTPAPSPAVNENTNLIVQPSPSVSVAPAAASIELEVEVLKLLNQIGADVGEEATVTRTPSGELQVQGVVESSLRKSEILRALAPLAEQPGLRIRIETSEEAAKRIKQEERTLATAKNKLSLENDKTVAIQPLEIRDTIPIDSELRNYLRSKGTPENLLTGEINRFAAQTLNHSNQVLLRSLALKNLAARFSESQLRSIKPAARNQWLSLIAVRAAEIANQNRTLGQELAPIFGSAARTAADAGGATASSDVNDEAGLKRAVARLSELAVRNDRAIRAAFTFSTGASGEAVKAAEFRQSLGAVDSLASSLESAARKLQSK